MKDQIDVTVRRSPKYSVFIGLGAILGILVAGILALTVDPAALPDGYTLGKGLGLLLMVLAIIGAFLGGFVALLLDRVGRRRERKYRVGAQIDMVDDPKEIARRRLAQMRGETPAEADDSSAPTDARADGQGNGPGDSAPTPGTTSADGQGNFEGTNAPNPGTTSADEDPRS